MAKRTLAAVATLLLPLSARALCGDGTCDGPAETQCNCPADCAAASPSDGCCLVSLGGDNCNVDPACACDSPATCTRVGVTSFYYCSDCGDGACDRASGEGYCNCPNVTILGFTGDCAPLCGDGCCTPTAGEDGSTCPADCLSTCNNNGTCEGGEGCVDCPADCGPCPDGGTPGDGSATSDGGVSGDGGASGGDGGGHDGGGGDHDGGGGGSAGGPRNLYACDCSLGARGAGAPGLPWLVAGGAFMLRARRRRSVRGR
jgi:hypothetical protein